jgi:hypothetical protein
MLTYLYQHGITGTLWNIFRNMYTDIKSCVKWQGMLSESFKEDQGIRQGGLSSTDLFKVKSNDLLNRASSHPLGYKIGITPVSAPTTADDTALVTSSQLGAQVLTGIAQQDAQMQRYNFNEDKSKVMVINQRTKCSEPQIKLNGKALQCTNQERHLGVERSITNKATATIECRVKEARRAMYRLAGAGMYGYNGVGPQVSLQILTVYVVPILTYGLESLILCESDYSRLEQFYKSALRRIQHFPESTALPAIYLLLGCIPLKGQIHLKMLSLFGAILRRPGSIEYDVIRRQLAIKDLTSNSWTTQIRKILALYNLPSPYKLLQDPPIKNLWKRMAVTAVSTFWMEDLLNRARSMKSLEFVDINSLKYGQVASIWYINSNPIEVQMATVKARLLVQRYPLGYSHYAGQRKSCVCILCRGGEETLEHFILLCPMLQKPRDKHVKILKKLLTEHSLTSCLQEGRFLYFILSPSKFVSEELLPHCERVTRQLIYKLHIARSALLGRPMKYSGMLKNQ